MKPHCGNRNVVSHRRRDVPETDVGLTAAGVCASTGEHMSNLCLPKFPPEEAREVVNCVPSSPVNETFEDASFKLSHDHLLINQTGVFGAFCCHVFHFVDFILIRHVLMLTCVLLVNHPLCVTESLFFPSLFVGLATFLFSGPVFLQSWIPVLLPDFVDFIFVLLKLASCFSTCLPPCVAFEFLLAKHPKRSQSFVAPVPTCLKYVANSK